MNWLDQVLGGSQGDLSGMATLDPEFARITNQRKMLEMLRQTGQNLGGPGRMVGGGGGGGRWHSRPEIYVPESNAGTALAQGVMGYAAGRGNQVLDQQEGAAMQDKQRRWEKWVEEFGPNAGGAQPAQMPSMNPPNMGGAQPAQMPTPNMGGAQPADMGKSPLGKSVAALSGDSDLLNAAAQQEAGAPAALPQSVATAGMSDDDKLKWLLRGSIQGIPAANLMINQAGNNLLTGEQRREAATALANQKFEQQFALQSERLKNAAELAASKATSAAELAKIRQEYALKLEEMRLSLQAAMHNDKMAAGYYTKTGKGGSDGGAGGGAGAGGVPGTGALERMDQINEQLRDSGGLVDTERGTLPNLATAIANTPMGQTVRRATGNENQALIDEAASLRNNILLDLKAETGLGTGSLNSNMELTTWLNSLGSEHMSYQARRNIMGNIREFIFRVEVARNKNGGRLPPEIEAGESPPPLTPEEKAMFMRQQGGGQTAPVKVNSEAEAMALPNGTRFQLNGRTGTVRK